MKHRFTTWAFLVAFIIVFPSKGNCPTLLSGGSFPCIPPTSDAIVETDNGKGIAAGRTSGYGSVSKDGAAQFSIPLWVPEGRAGIKPELSLQYNSRNDNGILGIGWKLNGFSTIARSRRTFLDDGEAREVCFRNGDDGDRFSLDGQRLVVVGGTNGSASPYGGHGTEYRTVYDSHAKIVSFEPDILGPTYFKVFQKDGRILTYGRNGSSTLEGARVRTNSEKTYAGVVGGGTPIFEDVWIADYSQRIRFAWLLSRIEDRSGNYLTITYNTEKFENGYEQLPIEIRYTAHEDDSTVAPTRIVEFTYEARPDTDEIYVGGFKINRTKRLKQVAMRWLFAPPSSCLLRSYSFKYRNDSRSGRSLLVAVEESDGLGIHKPSTRFEWDSDTRRPDLSIKDLKILSYSQNSVKYLCTIMNMGEATLYPRQTILRTYLSANEVLDDTDITMQGTPLEPQWPESLEPGYQFTGTFESRGILNTPDTPFLIAMVEDGSVEECDTTNNTSKAVRITSTPFNPEFDPDLIVSDLQVISLSTSVLKYRFTITNYSGFSASIYNIKVRAQLSEDEVFGDTDDIPAGETNLSNYPNDILNPGCSQTYTCELNVSVDPEKRPYLLLNVNPDGALHEWNRNNNFKSVRLKGYDEFLDLDTGIDVFPPSQSCYGRFTVVGDTDGDGHDEYVDGEYSASPSTPAGYTIDPDPALRLVDIDGDGCDDFITFERPPVSGPPGSSAPNLIRNVIRYSNCSQSITGRIETDQWSSFNKLAYVLDLDGNGLPEILKPLPQEITERFQWAFRSNSTDGLGKYVQSGINADVVGSVSSPNLFKGLALDVSGSGRMSLIQLPEGTCLEVQNKKLVKSPRVIVESSRYRDPIFADVNGDGLRDWVSKGEDKGYLYVSINTGNGFLQPVKWAVPAPYDGSTSLVGVKRADVGFRVIDFNGDGREDLLLMAGCTLTSRRRKYLFVLESTGRSFKPRPLSIIAGDPSAKTGEMWAAGSESIQVGGNSIDEWRLSQTLDLNGDGLTDFTQVVNSRRHEYIRRDGKGDLLTRIIDGFGAFESFEYRPISNNQVYFSSVVSSYPNHCVNNSVWLVYRHIFDGADAGPREFKYFYENARKDMAGRGWLGFNKRKVIETIAGIQTITEYDNLTQKDSFYPFAFLPRVIDVEIPLGAGNVRHKRMLSRYRLVNQPNGKSYFVYLERADIWEWEGKTGDQLPLIKKMCLSLVEDSYGNPTTLEELVYDVIDGKPIGRGYIQRKTAEYDNFEDTWIVGQKMHESILSATRSGRTMSRELDYEYYSRTGLLWKVRVDPRYSITSVADNKNLFLETTLDRDKYGFITAITREGSGEVRIDSAKYDDTDHQFLCSWVNAAGHVTKFNFHQGLGTLISICDPNDIKWSYKYDGFGRLRYIDAPDDSDVKLHYDFDQSRRYRIRRIRVGGVIDSISFDRLGREVERCWQGYNGTWVYTQKGYDLRGRVIFMTIPHLEDELLRTRSFEYDNLNRLSRVNHPDGTTQNRQYMELKTRFWDESGNESYIVQDGLGRVVTSCDVKATITEGLGGHPITSHRDICTQYEYGPFNLLEGVKDAYERRILSIGYDVLGRRVLTNDADSGPQITSYNAFNEAIETRDGNGDKTSYVRDPLGRIKSIMTKDGKTTFVWDTAPHGVGKLAQSTSADQVLNTFAYDDISRQVESSQQINGESFTFSYAYDQFGRPSTVSYPSMSGEGRFSSTYNYNSRGYLESVADAAGSNVYWSVDAMDAMGRVIAERFGNDVTTTKSYTVRGYLDSIKTQKQDAAAKIQDLEYYYEKNGNLKIRYDHTTNPVTNEDFSYDSMDRLSIWNVNQPDHKLKVMYDYDDVGNLLTRTVAKGTTSLEPATRSVFMYGSGSAGPHAVKLVRTETSLSIYTYDMKGNQRTAPNRIVEYTAFNLPSRITHESDSTIFKYDASGARAIKIKPNSEKTIYFGGLYERRQKGNTVTQIFYIRGRGRTVAQVSLRKDSDAAAQATVLYMHNDFIGSVDAISDASGNLVEYLAYDPFGTRRIRDDRSQSQSSPFSAILAGFADHNFDDELGLINMKGRMYDPKLSRFLTADPIVANPLNGQSFNAYSYALNNPLRYTDPTGLEAPPTVPSTFPGLDCTIPSSSEPAESASPPPSEVDENSPPTDGGNDPTPGDTHGGGPNNNDPTRTGSPSADDRGKNKGTTTIPYSDKANKGPDQMFNPYNEPRLRIEPNPSGDSPLKEVYGPPSMDKIREDRRQKDEENLRWLSENFFPQGGKLWCLNDFLQKKLNIPQLALCLLLDVLEGKLLPDMARPIEDLAGGLEGITLAPVENIPMDALSSKPSAESGPSQPPIVRDNSPTLVPPIDPDSGLDPRAYPGPDPYGTISPGP
jgi:RHS repeat-associated protein